LSVRLTGQGSNLSRTLRGAARDARAASGEVDELRRSVASLRAETRQRIRIGVQVDSSNLRDDVQAAINGAGNGQGLAVRLRLTDTMQLRRDVADAVRWASMGHRIDIPIGLRDLNGLRAEVTAVVRAAALGQSLNIPVTLNTNSLRPALTQLTSNLNQAGNAGHNGFQTSIQDLGLLAAALLPVAAAAVPVATRLLAAGAGATAFGIAIAGQIATLSEAADAQKKYEEAVEQHGAASTEAATASEAYQIALSKLPKATRETAAAFTVLKEDYQAWSDALADTTMPVATKGLQIMDALLPHLTPFVEGAAGAFDRLMTAVGGEVNSAGFDKLMDSFSEASTDALNEIVTDIIRLSQATDSFTDGDDVQEFLAYCRENGPLVAETLKNLTIALMHVLTAASGSGVSILTLANALAKLVNAVPSEAIGVFLQLYTAMRLLRIGIAGVTAVTGSQAAAGLAGFVRSARFGGVGPAIAGVAQRMTTLQKAAGGLGILGAVAIGIEELSDRAKGAPPNVDRLVTSLKELAATGETTGELEATFGSIDGFVSKLNRLDAQQKTLDRGFEWPKKIAGVGPIIDTVAPRIDNLLNKGDSIEALEDDFASFDQAFAQLVSSGHADLAAEQFARYEAALKASGRSQDEINALFPEYTAAVADFAVEQEIAAQSMGLFGRAAIDTQAKLDAQRKSADGLRMSILALNEVNRAAGSAMSAFEQSIDDATKAAKDHAGVLKMRDGELDLGSEKAREAEKVLSDLAANTDQAASKAREQGKSWEYVQGIMARGKEEFVTAAQNMGLTKQQAEALAQAYLSIPDSKSTTVEMKTEDAIAGLDAVIAAIQKTPGKKSVTVDALTDSAITMLENLGLKVRRLPNGKFEVTAATATAQDSLAAVQTARDGLKSKNITIDANPASFWSAVSGLIGKVLGTSYINVQQRAVESNLQPRFRADGAVVDYYAEGGMRARSENHVAQIAPAGSWRVWAEPETGGEGYVPFAPSKRGRSRVITEEIVRRLGGDPSGIQWNADGSVTGWRYDPQSGSLYSPSEAGQAGHKTRKVKVKVKGKVTTKDVDYFDLGAVEKRLKSISKLTIGWNNDLQTVADRAGGDVAEALAAMGEDGMALARKMAHGSTKYINEMSAALRNLQRTAKASLTDYTRQLGNANKLNKDFADDLARLAGMGYGELAAQLAAQNDTAAQQLADAAVKDRRKAAAANTQAKAANQALTADQVQALVQIIAAITTNKTGIHDVAAKTGLGEDEIIAVANKAKGQIQSSLGSRATRFLADLGKANKHMAYADGGIRAGLYATRGGIIRFAEPETGGEAFLPLSASKRRSALPVLADVAHRFGLGLTDAQASRPVVIVREGGDTHVTVTAVRTGATASDIGAQVGRSVRRARRGGVAARAA
jgi:hypothetical protein